MATTYEKLFVNISQLTSEKDWLVWKFQVKHALKAADQWNYVTGTADPEVADYESKNQKAFLLSSTVHWTEIRANGDELSNPKGDVGCTLSVLRMDDS